MSFSLAFLACALCTQSPALGTHTDTWHAPILPASVPVLPENRWVVGVAAERFGDGLKNTDGVYGLNAMYQAGPFAPHVFLMARPAPDFNELKTQLGLGLRSYFTLLGREWSYGVSAHLEIRLEDHFWLAYATPLELGSVLYAKNSWNVQLFIGARGAFTGKLIDNYLIDPNGFDNSAARDNLDQVTRTQPWLAFTRLSFSRIIE